MACAMTTERLTTRTPIRTRAFRAIDRVGVSTVIWKGLIVIGNAAGDVFGLNPQDGSPAWSHHFKGIITSTGASGDVLYVGTQEGMVFAVRRPTRSVDVADNLR